MRLLLPAALFRTTLDHLIHKNKSTGHRNSINNYKPYWIQNYAPCVSLLIIVTLVVSLKNVRLEMAMIQSKRVWSDLLSIQAAQEVCSARIGNITWCARISSRLGRSWEFKIGSDRYDLRGDRARRGSDRLITLLCWEIYILFLEAVKQCSNRKEMLMVHLC